MSRIDRIGRLLRERREELGLTHEDVHEAIRVPIAHLRALESGDTRGMASPAYLRGFIRSYCAHLELAPEPFLYVLDDPTPAVSRPVVSSAGLEPGPDDSPAWLTDVIAWGAVLALILLGWFSYNIIVRPFADDPQVRVEAGGLEAETTDFFPLEFPVEEE